MAVVLIVDDESKVRELVRRWLEKAGYQTLEAADASTALKTLTAHPAGVVLCDVRMPAVVFATGIEVLPPADTLRDGVVAYVLKPFDRAPLLDAVERAVRWHAAAKAGGSSTPANGTDIDRWLKDES
jgi:CheY-like chemotaxis protein